MGNVTAHTYDANGNTLTTTDANGLATSDTYDALNRLSTETDAGGGVVSYGYDDVGNRTSMTDANGHTTSYGYDALSHLLSVTNPMGDVTSYTYDPVGNRLSRLDANGATTTYTYDGLNRLTRITYPDQPPVSYTYDALGNRLSMTDLTGTTSYTYGALYQLTSVVSAGGTVSYGYDAAGNRISTTYPDGKVVSYGYDDASRLANVTDWASRVTTYSYDAASRPTGTDLPNGVHTARSYNNANQLLDIAHSKDANNLMTIGYAVDDVGNRLTRSETVETDPTLTDAYGYDNLYRLTSVNYGNPVYADQTYAYDPMGNRTQLVEGSATTNYSYDAADRLLTEQEWDMLLPYAFDDNGNQVSEPHRSFTYDRENRLIQVADWTSDPHGVCADANWDGTVNSGDLLAIANSFGVKGGAAGYDPVIDPRQDGAVNAGDLLLTAGKLMEQCTVATASAYNGDGLRVYKSDSVGKMSYAWDTQASLPVILQQSDGMTYEYGQELLLQEKDGTPSWYLQDGLGSTVELTNAAGAVAGSYIYDVFGSVRSHSGSANAVFTFTGQPADVTGMQYLRARFFEPRLGRLITLDPEGREPGNPYSYADDNPALLSDPTGLISWGQVWDSYSQFAKRGSVAYTYWFLKINEQLASWAFKCYVPGGFSIDLNYLKPPQKKVEPPSGVDYFYLAVASAYYIKPSQAPAPRPAGPIPGVLEPHPMGSPPPRPIPPALDPIVLQLSSFNGRK
jgi:RHS repeat-associated protein